MNEAKLYCSEIQKNATFIGITVFNFFSLFLQAVIAYGRLTFNY